MKIQVTIGRFVAALAACACVSTGAASAQQLAMEPLKESGSNVYPAYEGWYKNDDGTYTLLVGYYNRNKKETLDIPIGPDIPFWLDGITLEWRGHRATVAEHAIGLFDFVTLMDYRNRADGGDGIVSHARTEMEIAERLGKRVVIGLETGEGELPKVTFKGLPRTRMEEELAATE